MRRQKQYIEEYVNINGIEQYFLHYRAAAEAPVLLYIHGGPGESASMFAYIIEEYAGRNYNIVYYDQRGAGKTWLRNRDAIPDTETLKQDLLETVLYIKKQYRKEKIGILGHSWGSVLGSMFALEHPEHTLCYIGCGQVINLVENERVGYEKLKSAVEQAGSQKDLRSLERIGEYPFTTFDKEACRKLGQVRRLQRSYHLASGFDRNVIKMIWRSPVTSMRDILPFFGAMTVNMTVMKELVSFDLRSMSLEYQVPVYYVLGENDQQTPVELGRAYFREITAPEKKLYFVKHAGHSTMLDNTKAYRAVICRIAAGLVNG